MPQRWKNIFLAFSSIIFYAWGEPRFIILMLLSVCVNFKYAQVISEAATPKRAKWWLLISVAINLGLLIIFKYTEFILVNLNSMIKFSSLAQVPIPNIALPVGISFYTFHAISYLIDVYRKNAEPNKSLMDYSLYIMLFPQLVAGPIIRYKDIYHQLKIRSANIVDIEYGIYRFVLGLAKKVLIANPLGLIADTGFDSPASDLTTGSAWLCLLAYSMQIYFDFSGYSDMAIGLARIFGFRFPENFNYPYKATSIQDFWRRWHISLSTWFRDYVYIPLGGNRLGSTRTMINLWAVFLLTGLWHGASWNFIIWGAIHGFFLMCEKLIESTKFKNLSMPRILMHAYVCWVVMFGWVFFRTGSINDALDFLIVLLGQHATQAVSVSYSYSQFLSLGILMVLAVMLACGFYQKIEITLRDSRYALLMRSLIAIPLLFISMAMLALGQYNPFIYFRF